jgi:ABC-type multidrug transport system ATPase subunit
VPQDDIIHKELTVSQALDYAARLRLPADTTPAERARRVIEVLETLNLTERKNVPIQKLSGGKRKRVSIGVELLTQPGLFFLDEATSGLDPGTESQLMRLLRQLADEGHTILLITHATKNVMLCDQVAFLAKGGHLAYYGPPEEALKYFGVQDFDAIYQKLEGEQTPHAWDEKYRQSPQFKEYVVERLQEKYGALITPGPPPSSAKRGSGEGWGRGLGDGANSGFSPRAI